MPAGNLLIIHQPNGDIVATGQKTMKQCEKTILDHMSSLAQNTEEEEIVSSYLVVTPYKKFGDSGVKAYSISRADLLEESTDQTDEPENTEETVEETEEVDIKEVVL